MRMKQFIFFVLVNILSISGLFAQSNEVSDILISNNKLVAVQVVLAVILVAIVIFLIRQEKQIKSLEEKVGK